MPQNRSKEAPLKVLFIQGVSRYGGALRSLLQTMRLFKASGGYPVLVTSREGRLTEECREQGIRYYTVPMGMWRKAKSWPLMPRVFYELVKIALSEGIEVIHCNTLWDVPYGLVLGALVGRPVVAHLRNVHGAGLLAKYHVNAVDAVVGVSFECLRFLPPDLRRRAVVVYNPREGEVEICSAQAFSIALVGRLDTTKGQKEFVEEVYSGICEKLNLKLELVGGPSAKERFLDDLAKQWEKRFPLLRYWGHVRDVVPFYKRAMFVVIPSLPSALEGVPRVAIEAFSLGKCAAATDSGGTREFVFEKTGVLVNEVYKLKDPVLKLALSPAARRRLGVTAARFVSEKAACERHMLSMLNLWFRVLQGGQRSQGGRCGGTYQRE